MVSGPARHALEFARRLVFRCRHDEILLRASALAFSTVLSLMPLLAVIWYFVARTLREQGPATFRMIAELLPYREEAVTAALQSFLEQSESVSGAALIGFFVVSLMTFLSVQETLSRIFGVVRPPSLWRRLLAFALLLFWGPLLIGSAYAGLLVLGQSSTTLGRLLRDSTLLGWLPALATLLGLAMLFWRASLGRLKLRHAFAGSLVATIALELLKVGFRVYVGSATEVQRAVYGTLAIAVFFVLSVQIGWIILLASAEVAACLGLPTGADASPWAGTRPDPWTAIAALSLLAERHGSRHPALHDLEAAERFGLDGLRLRFLLAPLVDLGYIEPPLAAHHGYRLKVEPEQISMKELLAPYAPIRPHPADWPSLPAPLAGLPAELQRAWASGLDDLTLADLLRPAPPARPEPAPSAADVRLDR
jgi:membrane protein